MDIKFKTVAYGSPEYNASLIVREEVLRRPLGLTLSAKDVEDEEEQIHIIGTLNNKIVCGLTARIMEPEQWQFRQIYVIDSLQGQGVGCRLLNYGEALAQLEGVKRIVIHSRIEIAGFYAKCGYSYTDAEYFDSFVPHQNMVKDI